ncbi:hypothetical protein [Deinococcus sp.]|uniref:hypothetical protein n=1 Tax=Deinococcus sp. TaxID=47478 RepID=UPI0025F75E38|nr:hypothetical protein [Deinococcus sp.]
MDEFAARMLELEQAIDDQFVRATLDAARGTDRHLKLELAFVGYDSNNQDVNERWQIVAAGVAEHSLSFGLVLPVVRAEHPRLRGWQEEHGRVMYASSPADAARLELDLKAVHDEAEYGPAEHVYHAPNWSFGVGAVASGPLSLLEKYRQVLGAHQTRPNLLKFGPRNPRQPAPTLILQLDWSTGWFVETFVIAAEFTAQRLPGIDSDGDASDSPTPPDLH